MGVWRKRLGLVGAAVAFGLGLGESALAAVYYDSEIFFGGEAQGSEAIKPNILFIFDTSGSMDSNITSGPSKGKKRLEVVQEAITEVLESTSDINAGLSRYSQPGGPILYPVRNIDDPAEAVVSASIAAGSDDAEETPVPTPTVDLTSTTLEISTATNLVGVRFANVGIPQGAKIVAARIKFTAYKASTGAATIKVHGHDMDDAPTFSSTVKISTRPPTEAFTSWLPDSDPGGDGDWSDQEEDAVDVTSIVQEIVNRPETSPGVGGWCGGNGMSFALDGVGRRDAYSFERNPALAPRLSIQFESVLPEGAGGCYRGVTVKQVSGGANDVEQIKAEPPPKKPPAPEVLLDTASTDLDLLFDSSSGKTYPAVGLRFTNVLVPKDAIIEEAQLFFYARANKSGAMSMKVQAVDSADAPAFPTTTNLSALALKTGMTWSGTTSWSAGSQYLSPSNAQFATDIQNIVGKPDWVYSNSLAFVITSASGGRRAYSYDEDSSRAPGIRIKWKGKFPGASVRTALKFAVADFKALGNTPISDVLAEGAKYYRGESVHYGLVRGEPAKRDARVSHPLSYSGGALYTPPGCTSLDPSDSACTNEAINGSPTYISPIADECQSNHIVFLTDGEPTAHDLDTSAMVARWTGTTCPANDAGEQCTRDIAKFLHTQDQRSDLAGVQTVTFHGIGFAEESPFLKDVAENYGGGKYYSANSATKLVEVFQEIITGIKRVNTSFVAAGVAVNQLNRLTHRDELYFAVFQPDSNPKWPGNLKRYRFKDGGIVDSLGADAVESNGFFKSTARSFWLVDSTPDGDITAAGGAAEHLIQASTLAETTVYTNVSGNALTATNNRVHEANSAITDTLLGVVGSTERDSLLQWARHVDVASTEDPRPDRREVGDPLHSRPQVVAYRNSSGVVSNYVFMSTNQGYLHAIDTTTGAQKWAFIPDELLGKLHLFKDNLPATPHPHGLDGPMTLRIVDVNRDGVVDEGKDKAYLYIGMRRGGSTYYALDVTEFAAPAVAFTIKAGTGGYDKLGETWSSIGYATVKLGGEKKEVLVFGGGYDPYHSTSDNALRRSADDVGNTIYMADANTGALLWDAKAHAMDPTSGTPARANLSHAIAADLRLVDLTGSGFLEHIYAADLGGQVFRFDLNPDAGSASDLATGGRLAVLHGTGQAGNRRFYNAPDVAVISREGGRFVAINVGSGYREHPLDVVTVEHFYSLRDYGVLQTTGSKFRASLDFDDLVNITNTVGDTNHDGITDASEATDDPTKQGWYMVFDENPTGIYQDGEKVLSEALTFNDTIIFTTYSPASASAECIPEIGSSRVYAVKVFGGEPTNLYGNVIDRFFISGSSLPGIAPSPQLIFPDEGGPYVLVGTQTEKAPGIGGERLKVKSWIKDQE